MVVEAAPFQRIAISPVTGISPSSDRISEVLPPPFGPMMQWISPG
jgi:hypothetical protein